MPDLTYSFGRGWTDSVDPTVNDDESNGFEVADGWLNTTTGQFFQCCDTTTGAAIWDGLPRNLTLTSTWVPTITGSISSAGITYSSQIGYYQRINNLVTASFYVELSSKGTASGTVRVSSFPLANNSNNRSARCSVLFNNCTLASLHTQMYAELGTNSTDASLTEIGSLVQTAYDFVNAANNSSFSGTLIYEV